MKKKITDDEIDLKELIISIWNEKFKVFLIALIIGSFIVTKFEEQPTRSIYTAKTIVKPISKFQAVDYQAYNSYLETIKTKKLNYKVNFFIDNPDEFNQEKLYDELEMFRIINHSYFEIIDTEYLFSLFLDQLTENKIMINAIKETKYIKKEDFINDNEYNNAILDLISSIKYSVISRKSELLEDGFKIEVNTSDPQMWERLLRKTEQSINKQIQTYLYESFDKLISNEKRIMQYKIEDIIEEISNYPQDQRQISFLTQLKKKLENNKDLERLENAFKNISILKSDDFASANIVVEGTQYELFFKSRNIAKEYLIILAGLIGLMLGLLYVIVEKTIFKRR